MSDCWVVVADSSRVRLFRKGSGQALEEFDVMLNPDSRLREQDLVTDGPGRGLNRSRAGRFAMSESESQREHSEKAMAAELAGRLRQARLDGSLDRLHVLAAPHFLGELRNHLDDETRELIRSETDKNVSRLDPAAIRDQLPEYL
ncbi:MULTISPECIES: host attachment protein [unclassified Wenzhouxiangella]|uniref:host attachment protein n=1 Tax=unclassified Wenzhouxiangella TaxID=2613841 RepID=UPI000E329F4C|nr:MULTISPECIES: host attachment protein [unclassified Wenzhouxiangella]RFF26852.1 host attachment protein [Wenzhouxiangella sp. 15181]RFP68494.1 host attachment protein [Wenzhouxiangella sp. 15190]